MPPISKHYKFASCLASVSPFESGVHSESRYSDGEVARYCRSIGLALFEDWHGLWRGWTPCEKRSSSTEAMILSLPTGTGMRGGRAVNDDKTRLHKHFDTKRLKCESQEARRSNSTRSQIEASGRARCFVCACQKHTIDCVWLSISVQAYPKLKYTKCCIILQRQQPRDAP
jgi:hypothetical protein